MRFDKIRSYAEDVADEVTGVASVRGSHAALAFCLLGSRMFKCSVLDNAHTGGPHRLPEFHIIYDAEFRSAVIQPPSGCGRAFRRVHSTDLATFMLDYLKENPPCQKPSPAASPTTRSSRSTPARSRRSGRATKRSPRPRSS